jgi:hypothetical protein
MDRGDVEYLGKKKEERSRAQSTEKLHLMQNLLFSSLSYLASLHTKHSGGKYQYVPAPCEVSSIEVPSWESSIILDRPKSVIFASPISSNKIFAVSRRCD